MLALRFTQKLLKDMNVAPVELGETDPLFSWHVNILQLRRKHIIFVNDSSRLCLIVNGIRSSQVVKLQEKFISELKEYLLLEGVKRSLINQYLFEAGEVSIGKTNAKSVLGTMNEMPFYCKSAEFDHTFDLCAWLNSLMYKPIIMKNLLKYSSKPWKPNIHKTF
ncbi:hypothetical protein NDS46_12540 [Paenibacillus thiaminolyticus]|uniref:DUF6933 domain-containing protein n=1 Tax=Paenibacillus thiaminolyticus TaxID=49283 RepID=UPI0023304C41|nr:hypothetical protein [Paenibacillus thiaminolyticus]WCF10613.1 hypothetical protein NDS46_12540 [Paenibacillus thiaminolyticus]